MTFVFSDLKNILSNLFENNKTTKSWHCVNTNSLNISEIFSVIAKSLKSNNHTQMLNNQSGLTVYDFPVLCVYLQC